MTNIIQYVKYTHEACIGDIYSALMIETAKISFKINIIIILYC